MSRLRDRLACLPITDFKRRAASAEQALYDLGITFTVYSDNNAIDRILPFDAIPRVLSAAEWAAYRTRRDPAGNRSQPAARRSLSRAEDPQGPGHPDRAGPGERQFSARNAGYRGPPQGVRQHLRHRHRPRSRGHFSGARRQCPHAVGRQLCDREPPHDAAVVSRSVGRVRAAPHRRLRHAARGGDARDRARRPAAIRRSCCCRRASTIRPISSMSSSPAKWACRWSRGATWRSRTTASTCARSADCAAST